MDFEPLNIRDSEPYSHGGPPGWLAFATIFGTGMVIALLAFVAGLMV